MNRKKIRNLIISLWILIFAFFLTAIFIKNGYAQTEGTTLNKLIWELTAGYRMKHVAATMVMYAAGAAISIPLCRNLGQGYAFLLAMPIGNALWGVVSALLLFVNIPYTPYVMAAVMLLGIGSIVIVCRKEYQYIEWSSFIAVGMVVLAVSTMATSGVFAIFKSSDSYYYVMQYGELIVQNEGLFSDFTGNFMTWTGISPALTSAYAAMWGFENIYAIHYLLVFSMYGFIAFTVYRKVNGFCDARISFICAVMTLITVAAIPAVSYLSIWVISNTYFMVYVVFLMMLPVLAGDKTDMRVIWTMALFAVWLLLSRIEAAPVICFFIICISFLNVARKYIAVLACSTFLPEVLYLLKVLYEYLSGGKQASQQELTVKNAVVILSVFCLLGVYLFVYHWRFAAFLRKHMAAFGIIMLMSVCIGLGVLDSDKFINNIKMAANNMGDWYWAWVPVFALILEIIKSCFKCRNTYFTITVWGFFLFTFAICMGRTHYLRMGVGDSYNRICMSIIPLYVVSTLWELADYFCGERVKKINEKNTNVYDRKL